MIAAKGAIIGATMLIPGVSGGTMAMILGIYDRLILSVSTFWQHKLRSLRALLWFCVGAVLGMFLFARPLLHLLERFPLPAGYFFVGAVAGGIPVIYRKAAAGGAFTWRMPVYVLAGVAIVLTMSRLPNLYLSAAEGIWRVAALLLAGVVAAVALVLPGISVSYLLLILGLYNSTIQAINRLDLGFLLPLGIGLVGGILLSAKLLDRLMTRHPRPTYLVILGFVLASVPAVFPGLPGDVGQAVLCLLTLAAGFGALYKLSHL